MGKTKPIISFPPLDDIILFHPVVIGDPYILFMVPCFSIWSFRLSETPPKTPPPPILSCSPFLSLACWAPPPLSALFPFLSRFFFFFFKPHYDLQYPFHTTNPFGLFFLCLSFCFFSQWILFRPCHFVFPSRWSDLSSCVLPFHSDGVTLHSGSDYGSSLLSFRQYYSPLPRIPSLPLLVFLFFWRTHLFAHVS